MKGKIGIWIDFEKAVVVSVDGNDHAIKNIHSFVEKKIRQPGEGKQFGRFGDQFLDHERTKENRRDHKVVQFAQEVVAELHDADEIVIFGPAEMKLILKKTIDANKQLAPLLRDVLTADSMTVNQMVAWVKQYYQK